VIALAAIIAASTGLSTYWAFRVPIFEALTNRPTSTTP
jgi:hypothetical protein